MAERVSVEAVGSAEDVLRRLVHERRLLEEAAGVLETYRKVVAELSGVEGELEKLKVRQGGLTSDIEKLEGTEERVLMEITKAAEELRERERRDTQLEVERLKMEVVAVEREYNSMVASSLEAKGQFEKDMEEYEREIALAKNELEGLRKEHGMLMDAIGRAARAVHS